MKYFFIFIFLISPLVYSNEYTVVFPTNDFYPQYKVDKENATGFIPEVLKKFAQDSKINFVFKSYPVKRYMTMFFNKSIDFIAPANPGWHFEVKKKFKVYYSNLLMKSLVVLLVKNKNKFLEISDLKSIVTISGYTYPQEIKSRIEKKIKSFEVARVKSLIGMVLKERVQAGFFHLSIAENSQYYNEELLTKAEKLPTLEYEYFLSSIKYPEIIDKFNRWLIANNKWVNEQKIKFNIYK